ncbi:MAG: Rab family GTPase [Promethearchaeota archaeon]
MMNPTNADVTLKLLLIGNAGTGKTTLALRYMTGLFKQNKLTLGVQFHVKKVEIEDEARGDVLKTKLQIWDFAGEKRFRFLLPSYCRGAHGGLFLYDVSESSSIKDMDDWFGLVRENAGDIPILLVGAKSDLNESRQVSSEDGMQVARDHGLAGFVETSSKTGKNVEIAFKTISKLMLRRLLKSEENQ